jgi:hypothetical protein
MSSTIRADAPLSPLRDRQDTKSRTTANKLKTYLFIVL